MARVSIIAVLPPLMMLVISCYCASYSIGGTFGAESHLNLTSTGYGTLKANNTSSGIGGEWNGTVFGAGYGNINDAYVAGAAIATKAVSLKPGDNISDIKSNATVVRTKSVFGELAKQFAQALFGIGGNSDNKTENTTKKPDVV